MGRLRLGRSLSFPSSSSKPDDKKGGDAAKQKGIADVVKEVTKKGEKTVTKASEAAQRKAGVIGDGVKKVEDVATAVRGAADAAGGVAAKMQQGKRGMRKEGMARQEEPLPGPAAGGAMEGKHQPKAGETTALAHGRGEQKEPQQDPRMQQQQARMTPAQGMKNNAGATASASASASQPPRKKVLTEQSLYGFDKKKNKLGVLLLATLYVFCWKRTSGKARQQPSRHLVLMRTAPELVYFLLFPRIYVELLLVGFLVVTPLVLWNFLALADLSAIVGMDEADSPLSILVLQMLRLDVLEFLLYSAALTWLFAYVYTLALHLRRAPAHAYERMTAWLMNANLFLTIGCLGLFALRTH